MQGIDGRKTTTEKAAIDCAGAKKDNRPEIGNKELKKQTTPERSDNRTKCLRGGTNILTN